MKERAKHLKQARQQAAARARENAGQRTLNEYRYQPPSLGRSGRSFGR